MDKPQEGGTCLSGTDLRESPSPLCSHLAELGCEWGAAWGSQDTQEGLRQGWERSCVCGVCRMVVHPGSRGRSFPGYTPGSQIRGLLLCNYTMYRNRTMYSYYVIPQRW